MLLFCILLLLCFILQGGSEVHVHWKGAAEIVLAACTSWLDADGQKQLMTSDKVGYENTTIFA